MTECYPLPNAGLKNGEDLDADEFYEDPDEVLGKPLRMRVKIKNATGFKPAPLAKVMFTDPVTKKIIETPALPATTGTAVWNFEYVALRADRG